MLRAVNGSARVALQGREVGELIFSAGGCTFRYTDDLLDPGHHVLGQVFEESPRQRFREPVGLPAWFANLLPEQGSGLRRYYASRFGERHLDDARLLLTLGSDLPGAAIVEPVDIPPGGVLVEPASVRVDGGGVHLSALAGAQLKMSLLRDGERFTLPASGESGGWIAKLPDRAFRGLAENEFLMMRWATVAGLDVPEVDLLPAAGVPDIFDARLEPGAAVYVIERFDRTRGGGRVHIEDLAQVTGRLPVHRDRDATYDGVGRLIRSVAGDDSYIEYLRRLVAMVLMGNADAHLKNWSIWYPDGRTTRLAPAYDLVCTTIYKTVETSLTFTLGGQRRSELIGMDEFRVVAEAAGFPTETAADVVRETAEKLLVAWIQIRREKLFPELIEHVQSRLARHPLTSDRLP